MHDYKFRQDDLSFRKPRHYLRKTLYIGGGLVLAAAGIYAASQLYNPQEPHEQESGSGGDSDIIPLALPPHSDAPEQPRPVPKDQSRPTATPQDRAFTNSLRSLNDHPQTASIVTTPREVLEAGVTELAVTDGQPQVDEISDTKPVAAKSPQGVSPDEKGTWIEHQVKLGDSLAKIFRANDLSPQLLQSILRSSKEARHLKKIRPNDKLRIHLDTERQFDELHLQLDALRSVKFSATDSGIEGAKIRKETQTKATAASGIIRHSLFSSASKVGLPDAITMKMAKIFGWDIDFALEIRPGDRFTVIYEELWAGDERVGSGHILAAEFVNKGRAFRAIRYENGGAKADYYSPDGMPLKKTFFRTPVKFTRISSGFSRRRWHPILRRARAHKGVDYAAPTGTPVIATGNATVEYRGWNKGYGRVVYLRHGRTYRTVYGHLSRFAKGLKKGDRVNQGEIVGYVGQSGLATGPHLHYEFHINGVHRNPLTVKAPIADPLSRKEMEKFERISKPLIASLEQTASDLLVADAR